MTTVDAHHHVWDPAAADYPWMTDELVAIRRTFDLDDLRPLLPAAGIDRTVLVQARSTVEETRELLALATGDPVAGVVGWVDLTATHVATEIAALLSGPGGNRLVGVRHQVEDEPDAAWLERGEVRRGLRAVAEAGLAYDLLVRTRELPSALATVEALPDLRFVIDHAAKPPIASRELGDWRRLLEPFGALPNVACKLSGLVTEADWEHWTPDDLRPVADAVLEIFGPERTIFGSDWPVCLLAADYGRVAETARQLVSGLSDAERSHVFGRTAARWYRLALD